MTPFSNVAFVSIVLPAFNEERFIETTLKSLLELDYPREKYEIIVVDNGSSDSTVEIAEKYADQVFVYPKVRVGAVRNYGVKHAKGEVIAFLDSDCVPAHDWLKSSIQYMEDNNCDAVGGVYLLRSNPAWVESSWIVSPDLRDRPTNILIGGSIIIKKQVFDAISGFDESVNAGEDSALARSLVAGGYKVHFAKSCAVIHLGFPRTLRDFTKRQFWHASSYLKSRKKGKPDLMFLATLLFLVLVIGLPFLLLFSFPLAMLALAGIVAIPMVLTLRRIFNARLLTFRLDRYFKMYILDFFYLSGRAAGLVKSILTELNILHDKKTYY